MKPDLNSKDLYARLGLSPEATDEAIRAAWRSACFRYHPDTGGDGADPDRLEGAREAFRVLSDAERRIAYDRERSIAKDVARERPRILSLENVLGNYEYLAGELGRATRRVWHRFFRG